jgi:hypothetical protein
VNRGDFFIYSDGYYAAIGDVVRYLRETASLHAVALAVEDGEAGRPRRKDFAERFECPGCSRLFTTPQGLGVHMKHAKRNRKLCVKA